MLEGKFSGWGATTDDAYQTTFIHWLFMLNRLGVSHPWNSHG